MAGKIGFDLWKRKVDAAVERLCGLSSDDLPDCPYYDWYEQGVSPASAARKAIKAANE